MFQKFKMGKNKNTFHMHLCYKFSFQVSLLDAAKLLESLSD